MKIKGGRQMPSPFFVIHLFLYYMRRVLNTSTSVAITRMAPMAISTHTHTGMGGSAAGAAAGLTL
jgi:hypothetical protein